jgi:hypothetical protein
MKNLINVSRTTKNVFQLMLATGILFSNVNCSDSEETKPTVYLPTAKAFNDLEQKKLIDLTQSFTINANNDAVTLTTNKGSKITFPPNSLTLNGNVITGNVDVKVIEIYDAGTMALTNKVTMGNLGNGLLSMLVSGGEFYINATKNGQQLAITEAMTLQVPTALTGGAETGMIMFTGDEANNGDLNWKRDATGMIVNAQGGNYNTIIQNFGWSNIDRFYSFSGPKTEILASAPTGYDAENSAIYLHYDGEASGLARLDTFSNGLFSEHYGQVPVGLACHLIFMTEDNGQWRYAIKPVTISANAVYNFTLAETTIGTEAQLIAAINNLP